MLSFVMSKVSSGSAMNRVFMGLLTGRFVLVLYRRLFRLF